MSRKSRKSKKARKPVARRAAKTRRSRPAPPPAPRPNQEVSPVAKKSSGKKKSGSKSKASKPKKKAHVRRGFALSSIAPVGIATQAAGGLAGFVGTGFAIQKLAERGRMRPGSMLAKLDDGAAMPAVARAAVALAIGWALRRFVSKPIGNAVAVGGLINAGASFAARTMARSSYSVPLLGLTDPAGIDLLHPEYDTSRGTLGALADEDIQNVLEAARSDAGMGDIPGNVDEGNLSPAAVAGIIRAA